MKEAFVIIASFLAVAFTFWLNKVKDNIKQNESAYKYKGSGNFLSRKYYLFITHALLRTQGYDKILAVIRNGWARKQIITNWKIKFGLIDTIKVGCIAPDASLVALNGKTVMSLKKDYLDKYSDIPLILHIGSYN